MDYFVNDVPMLQAKIEFYKKIKEEMMNQKLDNCEKALLQNLVITLHHFEMELRRVIQV
jgi:hypothetical protein